MITIKRIEIKGYFGRGDFEWNLDSVVNILGGKNGSGKSSIFKLCYLLLSNKTIDDDTDKKFMKIFKEVKLTYSNGWTQTWVHQSNNDDYTLEIGGSQASSYRTASQIVDINGQKRTFEELQKQIKVYLINSFEQHVADATSYEQQPKSETLNDPTMLDLMIKNQIDQRNKDFSKIMEDIVDMPEDSTPENQAYIKAYRKTYTSINHFLNEYDKPKSSFEFIKKGETIKYDQLSMGEKQILLLMLMVGNTKQEPCIFFMDEPDLSMHIDWKEILVKELHELNPNMQIILSTHAPSVITGWHDRVKEVSQLIK
ncbi:MAG: AAA family ATPase [Bacteroidaceae bacterium]|nr:AAA family ATPase [Bacteroidaceae bacterium]